MKTVRYIPAPKKKPQLSKTQEARWVYKVTGNKVYLIHSVEDYNPFSLMVLSTRLWANLSNRSPNFSSNNLPSLSKTCQA